MPEISQAQAESPYVLALDMGTSWVRAGVYDRRARRIGDWHARRAHPTTLGVDGAVVKDPMLSLELLAEVIDEVMVLAGAEAEQIAGVGLATLASSLAGVAEDGSPLTPLYLYSDTRPAREVQDLRTRLEEDAVHQRTGCRLHTSYLPARLLWLAVNEPVASSAARHWLALADFVYFQLFGRTVTSYSLASWSGLLDVSSLDWDRQLLQVLQVDPRRLPKITREPLSDLKADWATRWPVLANVPWFPAWGDGAASNVGVGCMRPDEMALSIGTTGALRVLTDQPPPRLPPALWRYQVDEVNTLVGGALNEGGSVMRWISRVLGIEDFQRAEALVATLPADAHGLTVLPFLSGERSPGWRSQLQGTISGLGLQTSNEQILQALMESVAYRFALVAEEIAALDLGQSRIVANGGAAAIYPVWLQMIADASGRTVSVSAEVEATARGVAALTLQALGMDDLEPAAVEDEAFEPDGGRGVTYRGAMARQQELYAAMVALDDEG